MHDAPTETAAKGYSQDQRWILLHLLQGPSQTSSPKLQAAAKRLEAFGLLRHGPHTGRWFLTDIGRRAAESVLWLG